jgi:hypothetical protein
MTKKKMTMKDNKNRNWLTFPLGKEKMELVKTRKFLLSKEDTLN